MLRCQLLNSTSSPNSTDIPDLSEYELEVLSVLSRCEEHRQVADCHQLISTKEVIGDDTFTLMPMQF